jgi:hypothetical protein
MTGFPVVRLPWHVRALLWVCNRMGGERFGFRAWEKPAA